MNHPPASRNTTFLYALILAGAFGPCVCAFLSAHGVNYWLITAGICTYAIALGLTARRLEKRSSWSGVALCAAVAALSVAIAWITARHR